MKANFVEFANLVLITNNDMELVMKMKESVPEFLINNYVFDKQENEFCNVISILKTEEN